ncbi:MAG: HlyD family efflux transporter periplasmic adaptor subunit [Pirellulales bacterium]|nr:HlyD family efflux transporter periplasmic adaptor subunit [Pirellulales bacterium]
MRIEGDQPAIAKCAPGSRHGVSRSRGRSVGQQRRGVNLLPIILAMVAIGGGSLAAWIYFDREDVANNDLMVKEVVRSRFVQEISANGTLQSANRLEIKCEVETGRDGVTIVQLPFGEGEYVEKGDLIAVLDSSEQENDLSEQQIEVNTAHATYIQSQNIFETAKIALEEYQDGTFRQERELIESEIFVAEENLKRAEEYHKYSKKLNALGYVTEVQLQADRFAVDKTQKELDTAKTKLSVLENYTQTKMVMTLKSEIRSAEAKMLADKESYDLELKKLESLEEQIEKCKIYAPAPGELVYANEQDRRGKSDKVIEELGTVWENQPLFWLPDKTQMQVRAKVNESRIGYIESGMPVKIDIDARWGEVLFGEVTRVDTYPVPQHWSASNVREYYVYVDIRNAPLDLRPGLSAEVAIKVKQLDDVLQIPMLSVLQHGTKHFCAVQNDSGGFDLREIEITTSNDLSVVISSGLKEGEVVAQNQREAIAQEELPPVIEAETLASGEDQSAEAVAQPGEQVVADSGERRNAASGSAQDESSGNSAAH